MIKEPEPTSIDLGVYLPKLQFGLLVGLKRYGPLTTSELARWAQTSVGSAGATLTALRADRLVKRIDNGPTYQLTDIGDNVLLSHFKLQGLANPYVGKRAVPTRATETSAPAEEPSAPHRPV